MILKTHQEEWADYEADVEKYFNEHFKAGWKSSGDPLELTNPTTDEFCSIYVASDEDFEPHYSDYDLFAGLDKWVNFGLFVENRGEQIDMEQQFKYIKYHVVISRSRKKMVVLDKANIRYCSDAGCFLRYARRSNVVDL